MLNPIEEAYLTEVKEKCRGLNVPPIPDIFIGLKVHDKDGVLTFDDVQRGHSWTRNFYSWIFFMPFYVTNSQSNFGAGYASHKRPDGTIEGNVFQSYPVAFVPGIISDPTYGLVVGTDDTVFDEDQYALGAIIAQGTGAGQFSYQASAANTIAYDEESNVWTVSQSRVCNNNSTAPITVRETGIYASNNGVPSMWERAVLAPPVAVAVGAQLTVTYNICMDFAAIDA